MQIRDRIKSLRRVRASELKPNPKNWRTHPEAQRNALRGVLAEVGYADALIARELKDGSLELIDGHLRAETTPDQRVPVLVLDVTAKEAELLLATLDPLAAMADADAHALEQLLAELDPRGEAVQDLLDSIAADNPLPTPAEPAAADPGPQTDYADRLVKKWGTKAGQLWLIPSKASQGDHRLVCGDSTKPADVERAAGGSIDLVITSPPYNVGIDFDRYRDSKPRDEYLAFIRAIAVAFHAVMADGRYVAWNIGVSPRTMPHHHMVILEEVGLAFYRQVVWQKVGLSYPVFPATLRMRRARHYTPNYTHDLVQILRKPGEPSAAVACPMCAGGGQVESIDVNCAEGHEVLQLLIKGGQAELGGRTVPLDRYPNDVWKIAQSQASRDLPKLGVKKGLGRHRVTVHPTPYPPELCRAAMSFLSAPGERVFDPFLGSGTTIVAAEQMGRLGAGVELSDRFTACALERFLQMGLKPKLGKK